MITVVNYGVGNLGSILNMFKKIGIPAKLTESKDDILNATKLLIPGVGSFDAGMQKLIDTGYIDALNQKVLVDKIPVLGICLGFQIMTKGSEEGKLAGLGWFDAQTTKFRLENSDLKVPHMGWNLVHPKKQSNLLKELYEEPRYYFVHSYHIKENNPADVLLTTHYGYDFTSGMQRENIYGTQFHPEKSHKFGMQLLKNFASYC